MASPANSISTQMTLRLWALLALLGLIWGGSFFFARVAVAHVPPFTLVFMRLSLAALALHFYLLGRHGIYQALAERWREFLLMGLINNAIPHAFIFLGQTHIGAGLAAILNATSRSGRSSSQTSRPRTKSSASPSSAVACSGLPVPSCS